MPMVGWAAIAFVLLTVGAVLYRIWPARRKERPGVQLRFERQTVPSAEADRYVLRVINRGDTAIQFSHDLILKVDVKTQVRPLMPAIVTSVTFPYRLAPRSAFQFEIEVDEMARVFKNIPDSGVFDVSCMIFDLLGRKYRSPSAPVSTYEMEAHRESVEHILTTAAG